MKISEERFFFLFLLAALFVCSSRTAPRSPKSKLSSCSKDFTEQAILAEILAQHIEAKTDITVKQEQNLAGLLRHLS